MRKGDDQKKFLDEKFFVDIEIAHHIGTFPQELPVEVTDNLR